MPNEIDAAIAGLRELDRLGGAATGGDLRPVQWQRFGEHFYLTGQYGMRPLYLSAMGGAVCALNAKLTLREPITPSHPDADFWQAAANTRALLKTLLDFAERAKAALEKIDSDNRVESGSPGPLYDAGFNFGWTCARTYAEEALNPEAKQ
jgi:hypothetical protein